MDAQQPGGKFYFHFSNKLGTTIKKKDKKHSATDTVDKT